MKLKVTIEVDGNPFSREVSIEETAMHFAPLLAVSAVQEALNEAGLMEQGETLEVLGSDESALLSKSGY